MALITGTDNRDILKGTAGSDRIYGFDGNDTIDGKEGKNYIYAGDGNDIIKVGKGRDLVHGDDGDDLINVVGNYSGTYIYAGNGDDTVSLDRAKAGTEITLEYSYTSYGSNSLESLDVTIKDDLMTIEKDFGSSTAQDDIVGLKNLGADGTIYLYGSFGDDEVDADSRDDEDAPRIIFYAEGNDIFNGSSDAYEEIVLSEHTAQYEISSSDITYDYQLNEIIITSNSSGQMSGRVNYDQFNGSDNDSFVIRFSAMDMIEGSRGDDLLTGSAGNDKFRPGYGNDGFNGGGGSDTVYYDSESIITVLVDLQYGYAESLFYNTSYITSDNLQYDGLRSVENAVGSHGDDTLRGSAKANTLEGGAGDDHLNGRKGNDTLIGGDGNDKLRGLGGKDKFVFDSSDGHDKIFRFEDGLDKIVIDDEDLTFSDVSIEDHGRHTLVTFGDTSVTLLNFDSTLLTESDFLFA